HRRSLQRLGLLEPGGRSGSQTAGDPGGSCHYHRNANASGDRRDSRRRSQTRRSPKNWYLQDAQPEGFARRPNALVLLRLCRALLSSEDRETRRLPQRAQEVTTNPNNSQRQAPSNGGLSWFREITIPPHITRGNQW